MLRPETFGAALRRLGCEHNLACPVCWIASELLSGELVAPYEFTKENYTRMGDEKSNLNQGDLR